MIAPRTLAKWGLAYVVLIVVMVFSSLKAREWTLRTFGTSEAQAEWNAWTAAARQQSVGGPVQRRVPKSADPPALVLMRDYFAVILTTVLTLATLVYAALVMAAKAARLRR